MMVVESNHGRLATIAWEGDSRDVLRSFPEDVKRNLGFQIWQLQIGERPQNYRPLTPIGMGVFELRDQDEKGWYRVVYLSRTRDLIHVLYCFRKKSREMPRKDFAIAKHRLKAVRARLTKEES